jgi:CHAT domain-containing protein
MAILAQYHLGRERGHLFLARAGGGEPTVVEFSRAGVYEELADFLRAVVEPSSPDIETGPGLRALVEPIARNTTEGEQICIVPHGVLHYLPFHALDTGDGLLGFRNPVCCIPSASTLRICRRGPRLGGKPSVVLGDSLEDLKYARREADAVATAFDVTPLLGPAATKDRFLSALAEHPTFDLVHFACHGEPGEVRLAAEQSLGVVHADSLTVDDILRRRIEAALVTVSACNSGIAQLSGSNEILGLTRALLYAGASSLLLSAWPIDDFSTYLFVGRCYEELRRMATEQSGSKALAVRTARRFVHELTLARVVELCDREADRCRSLGDSRGELDFRAEGAAYAASAGDLEEACRRYQAVLARLELMPNPPLDRKDRLIEVHEELEFRQVLRREAVDYTKRPFASASHWGSFTLHGDWRL